MEDVLPPTAKVGIEAAGSLTAFPLNGYSRSEDCEAVRRAGFNLHLVKPLKPGEISRVLSEHTSRKSVQSESQ
ncbi:MAG: domain S-box protein [Planctomycetaceae bacterium]|nr:domain S-box protein [Planctomycetaceae bacterium]